MQNAPLKKPVEKKLLLQALKGEVTERIPFWLMRQAGRYLPEYRALRQKAGSFLDLCFHPEWAAEVTLQPIRRFGMDAAILFSDILVVPYALGQALDFAEGEGPKLGGLQDIADREFDSAAFDRKLQPVYETLRRVREGLEPDKALIGFAGAPWTVACYMVQGQGGNNFLATQKFAFGNPAAFDKLIAALVEATAHYLISQIRHGADTVQIFDSWAGLLPPPYFERWVIEPTRQIVARIRESCPGVPVTGFPRQAGDFYADYVEKSGVDCVGIDQDFSLEDAVRRFGGKSVLQGNLDPASLLAGGSLLEDGVRRILQAARATPFVFNLGHGVIKETPPEHVALLSKLVGEHRR